jgi:hypothetical protein
MRYVNIEVQLGKITVRLARKSTADSLIREVMDDVPEWPFTFDSWLNEDDSASPRLFTSFILEIIGSTLR